MSNIYFSLISPIYNEEKSIIELVDRSISAFDDSKILARRKWEYILVDDASTDSSRKVISSLIKKYPSIVKGVSHKYCMGQSGALRTGFFLGQGEVFGTLDSDLEKLPEDTPKMLKKYMDNKYDIITAYIKEKNMVSRIGNYFLRLLFGHKVQQASTNQMIIGAEFIKRVNLINNDQRYVLPIALSKNASKISEVETSYIPRKYGYSKYKLSKKIIQGLPEMLMLKKRISSGFYDLLLDDEYKKYFDIIY